MRNLTGFCFCSIIGIAPLMWLAAIPQFPVIAALLAASLCIAFIPYRLARYVAFILLCFCWALINAKESLAPFEKWTGKPVTVEAIMDRSDGKENHELRIVSLEGLRVFPSVGIRVRGEYFPNSTCAGQRWRMKVHLRPVHGQLNVGGFDSQRYALAQRQPLSARIISA